MSFSFLTNFQGTGAQSMYQLKTLLKAAGWTVPRSSDGTTYNSSGDQITSGSSGAGGMANNSAWFVIQMPTANSVNRQICIQRGITNTVWRVKYSYSAGFTGGSPGATQTPSATDEQILNGGGTDASPTFTTLFGTDSSYWLQAGADNAAPYGFWCSAYATAGRTGQMVFMCDPVTGNTGDTDPYVFYVLGTAAPFGVSSSAGSTATDMNNETTPPFKAWFFKGLAGEAFAALNAATYMTATSTTVTRLVFPLGLNLNGWTNLDDNAPVPYVRRNGLAAPVGFKGTSTLMQFPGPQRNTADTQGNKARIIFAGTVSLPWDGSTTPQ